jgi:RNA polymerase sigma-70 factor (ECF subfamily)
MDPFAPEDFAGLMGRIRAGDPEAAAELVRHFEAEIRLEVRTWLRLRDPRLRRVFDSMDVCQSVLASFFLRAAAGAYDLEQPAQLVGLLVSMARNKLRDQVKHHQRERRDIRRTQPTGPEHERKSGPDQSPSQLVAGKELLNQFRRRLSEEEKRLADLRTEGQDWAAIAAALGGTPDGRRKQWTRVVDRVAGELGLAGE